MTDHPKDEKTDAQKRRTYRCGEDLYELARSGEYVLKDGKSYELMTWQKVVMVDIHVNGKTKRVRLDSRPPEEQEDYFMSMGRVRGDKGRWAQLQRERLHRLRRNQKNQKGPTLTL